jgi:LPXTG-motif cell wall-anchored protein
MVPNGNVLSLQFYDKNGNKISAPNGVAGEYVSGDGKLTLTVENLRGYELPSTGGMGMHIYILCGLFLMMAPLVYGFSMRRKYERRFR